MKLRMGRLAKAALVAQQIQCEVDLRLVQWFGFKMRLGAFFYLQTGTVHEQANPG